MAVCVFVVMKPKQEGNKLDAKDAQEFGGRFKQMATTHSRDDQTAEEKKLKAQPTAYGQRKSTRNGFIGKCESRRLSASENEAELTAMHLTVIADDPFLRDAEERCKRVPAKDDATGEMLPTDSAFFSDGDTIL
ncbi:hypothetical protein MMC12_002095 [Toensbergia leucococca]|nr:hypothetical protein [Toensbergia leucococca]